MSYFGLDPAADSTVLQNLRPLAPDEVGSWSLGADVRTVLKGPLQAGAQAALAVGDYGTKLLAPLARGIDDMVGGTGVQDWLRGEQQKNRDAVANLMPDPQASPVAQGLYGAGVMIPQGAAGFALGGPVGAAAAVGTLQGYAGYVQAKEREHLDDSTAALKGGVEGAAAAAGIFMPAGAGSWGRAALAGVAGNVPLGIAQRSVTHDLLLARGYGELARQYAPLDTAAIGSDLVIGALFGVFGKWSHDAANKPDTATVHQALDVQNERHAAVDTAPAIPATPEARTAHAMALEKALSDIATDRPVDVSTTPVADAEFVPHPAEGLVHVQTELARALDEVEALRAEVARRGLSPADEALFSGDKVATREPAHVADTQQTVVESQRTVAENQQGRRAEVFVGDRAEPVRFQVVEADTLGATMGKADNQFRDRTRAAGQLQVERIANDLQFGRLGDAPTMAEGAPTLAADGRVIGGNGRVAAIQRAYERGTAEAYKQALVGRAAEFGLDPAALMGMQRPVLVRQFENAALDVRQAAILSNEGGALRMSALEQAKVDAERLPDLRGVDFPESGDLTAASMRDAVRQWVGRFPQSEQAALLDADGRLSAEGALRLRNAILHEAYGDSPTLARLVESTDPGARNVAAALVKAAPNVAEARHLIETGDLYDLDIQPHLLEAVETWQTMRADGVKLDDLLAQGDLYGGGPGPEATLWLRHMADNTRSQKAIAEAITGYYDAVRALGNPKQAGMFDLQPPGRGEVLAAVLKREVPADLFAPAEAPAAPARTYDVAIELRQMRRAYDLADTRLLGEQQAELLSMYEQAERAKPAFDEAVATIAQDLAGQAQLAPIKGTARAAAKAVSDYGDVRQLKDLLRATIVVQNLADARVALERLAAEFKITGKQRNLFDDTLQPADGYRDAKVNVRLDNGLVAEVQVSVPEMVAAKEAIHGLYEQRAAIERAVQDRGDKAPNADEAAAIARLNEQMRAVTQPAWEASKSRAGLESMAANASGDTAAPLRRAESGGKARGASPSQAEQKAGAPGKGPSDTGTPSTSNNSTPDGTENFMVNTSDASVSERVENATPQVGQVLEDTPNAQVTRADGSEATAAAALAEADAAIARAERDADGYAAAVACFLRG
jgi:hypothetical protein